MRGNLLIGRTKDENGNTVNTAGNYTGRGDTFSLIFGHLDTGQFSSIFKKQTAGGSVFENEFVFKTDEPEGSIRLESDNGRFLLKSGGEVDSEIDSRNQLSIKSRFGNLRLEAKNETIFLGSGNQRNDEEIRSDSRRVKFRSGAYFGRTITTGNNTTEVNYLESFSSNWESGRNSTSTEYHTPRWCVPRMKFIATRINGLRGFWRNNSGTIQTANNGEWFTSNAIDLPHLEDEEIIAGVDISWSAWGSEGIATSVNDKDRARYINGVGIAHHDNYSNDVEVYTGFDFIQEEDKGYVTLHSPGKNWPFFMQTVDSSGGNNMGSIDVIIIFKVIDLYGD
jgi:hypothetical protein